MIKKIILSFIILFAVYYAIVLFNPGISATQQQWQDNVVKAEKYIYNGADTIDNVILGSSLARRIVMDSLPHYYNLAFAGQGIYDGLEILNRTKRLPKNIFIETNTVFTEANKSFTDGIFDPISYNVKKYCISLRSDKQPLAFAFPAVQSVLHNGKVQNKEERSAATAGNTGDNGFFDKMIKMQVQNYTWTPDTAVVNKQFAILTTYINDLKSKGAKIIFFELPLNPKIVKLPLANLIRTKFEQYFPASQNNYIVMPDCSNYVTGDGLHLKDEEAKTYTSYFKEEAKKYYP